MMTGCCVTHVSCNMHMQPVDGKIFSLNHISTNQMNREVKKQPFPISGWCFIFFETIMNGRSIHAKISSLHGSEFSWVCPIFLYDYYYFYRFLLSFSSAATKAVFLPLWLQPSTSLIFMKKFLFLLFRSHLT